MENKKENKTENKTEDTGKSFKEFLDTEYKDDGVTNISELDAICFWDDIKYEEVERHTKEGEIYNSIEATGGLIPKGLRVRVPKQIFKAAAQEMNELLKENPKIDLKTLKYKVNKKGSGIDTRYSLFRLSGDNKTL